VPELPEVETIVRELRPLVRGRAIVTVHLAKTDVLRGIGPAAFRRTLAGRRILSITRRAKHVVIRLDSGRRLVVQPRMTGSLIAHRAGGAPGESRYRVLTLLLNDGTSLVYRDVRRLGTLTVLDEPAWRTYTARAGPEPLAASFTRAVFAARLAGSKQAIKKAIMDQRRIAGVGNIYANEALFRARIDPSRRADRLTPLEMGRLYRAVRAVLGDAVASRGTTVRDYRTGTGQRGRFQQRLRVYGRGGAPCVRCGRRLVTTHAIDGRATTFCVTCQGCATA